MQERVKYYNIDYAQKGKRTVWDRALDYVAVGGLGYLGLDWLWGPVNKGEAERLSQEHWKKSSILKTEMIDAQQKALGVELSVQATEKDRGIKVSTPVKWDATSWAKQIEYEQNKASYYENIAAQSSGTWRDKTMQLGIRTGIILFAIYRVVNWTKSREALAIADTLSDVNRAMIVYLTETLISYLERLAQLCDEVKEESDIARLKDDFEFISKNCGETFVHIARIINQEEAIKLQRLGKPGQATANFGQSGVGSGLGGGLPRF